MDHSTPYTYTIRELAEEQRPRERLAEVGAEALSDTELLAILLRTGKRSMGALALAQELYRHFGDLRRIAQASLEELQLVDGVGRVKAIEIKAALELGMRLGRFHRRTEKTICSPADVAELLIHEFKHYETERFVCIQVNAKNEVRKMVQVTQGGMDWSDAAPRDVFRQALRDGAHGVILAHNHPSGNPEPSQADISVTRRLAEAARLLGIALVDHVILGDGQYVSMKDRGLL